ncbi:ATP-dependent DNA helicase [Sandarakinorhabdus sp.]|uniref:ATP-dependent DNA helicase n=1 Tax=Sandarakinorhabdus sp. TaxID=1916663 RepID=UPI0033412FBA
MTVATETAAPLAVPALVASHAGVWIADADGRVRGVGRGEAIARAGDSPHLLLNAPVTASRLGLGELSGLDLLELFAFLCPARFCVPTARGLAAALGLPAPAGDADAAFLQRAAAALLAMPARRDWPERRGAWTILQSLGRQRWPWAPHLLRLIAKPEKAERHVFQTLPQWEEAAARPAPQVVRLPADEVAARLARLVGPGAEQRDGQRAYADAVAQAFAPKARKDDGPQMVLAEAGTGIGKTLGYLAPASLWAEMAGGAVWVATFTKALQRQLDGETARVWPDAAQRRARVVVRKGRENYLCLLNLEDAVQGGFGGRAAVFARLAERWAEYTRDGDMVGGDLPGWLPPLFGRMSFAGLTDRRGECIYAACPHYRTCFIERASRASAQADLVIANHALVMINAARGRAEGTGMARIIFDEGHHLFDAADATFAVALTGREAVELKNWLLGPERAAGRGRRRGLSARLADAISYDDDAAKAVERITDAARALPSEAWLARVADDSGEGALELLFAAVRTQVLARAPPEDAATGYGLETQVAEVLPCLVDAAAAASAALGRMALPMAQLEARLALLLDDPPDWLDGQGRARVEGARAGLVLRGALLSAWQQLLARLGGPADADFIDWLELARADGRLLDVGIQRRWLDPMRPFAAAVLEPAHGVVVTSATLRARPDALADDWRDADARTGAVHLPLPARHFAAASPFDYAHQARVLIVTDVKPRDVAALAHAYRTLIEAAGGGTLGLFTAIARLRAVHARLADPLARAGLPLYAQHVDPIDTGTLVDIFRAEPGASLLGTDALRDGVDVPGSSLRQVIMEGVPWPRRTVLHAARRLAGGGNAHDDRVTMGRLAQAFGRLIRRADDRGHFILLGPAVPSRLLGAFPAGVPIDRVTLDEAAALVRAGFARTGQDAADVPSADGSITPGAS